MSVSTVFISPAEAAKAKYTVVKDDTLASIAAAKCKPPVTWKEIALYNFGTAEPDEVRRALVELLGCTDPKPAPDACKLDPALATSPDLLLPVAWKGEGLATEKTHTIQVKRLKPAPAIRIAKLDKWFLPGRETCDLDYALEGPAARADKVDLAIYASGYCTAAGTETESFVDWTYTAKPDTPIWKKQGELPAEARKTAQYRGWKGESEAADGILKKRGTTARYVNVASSPYTVVLTYYKKPEDAKARIELEPFWVRFDEPTAGSFVARNESLKVKWKVKDGPRLKHGQLLVWDKTDDHVIFRKALDKTLLDTGTLDLAAEAGFKKDELKPENLPYRVQIQAHTAMDDDNGVAVAVMHAEVRLFVHPQTATNAADPAAEPNGLELALAPFLPDAVARAATEGDLVWYRTRLAALGFHPGPAHLRSTSSSFEVALKEFQRSFPKDRASQADPHERLDPTGAPDAATQAAVKREATALPTTATGLRPLFGNPDDRSDLARDATSARLGAKDEEAIVWIDDRHTRTDATAHGRAHFSMRNYNPESGGADGKVAQTDQNVARPWLPIEVTPLLLTKRTALDATAPVLEGEKDDSLKAMRAALGPVRVDWTFTEIGEDYTRLDPSAYDKRYVRTKAYVKAQVDHFKATHDGKEATNCPIVQGGIRPKPDSGNEYFKAPFGIDAGESLLPWKAVADSGTQVVCTVAHADLGADERFVHADRVGKAGIYLRPSIVGGDGYRFRARLSFEDLPSGASPPNWKALRERYPKLPHAHTCKMRNWRKTSIRGYIRWAAPTKEHWGNYENAFPGYYRPAFLHFVHEGGAPGSFPLAEFFDPSVPADVERFKDIIHRALARPYNNKTEMSLSADYVWPWVGLSRLGVRKVPPPGVTFATFRSTFLNDTFWNKTWRKFREPLMHEVLARVESKHGRFRGHLIVEFDSPPYWLRQYFCRTCRKAQIRLERTGTSTASLNRGCRISRCAGSLELSYTQTFVCGRCGAESRFGGRAAYLDGVAANEKCHVRCADTLTFVRHEGAGGTPTSTYRCDRCGDGPVPEPAPGGAHDGDTCRLLCPGTLTFHGQPSAGESRYDCPSCGRTYRAREPAPGGGCVGPCPETCDGTWTHLGHAVAGGVEKGVYHCATCAANYTYNEVAPGGAHTGEVCGEECGGAYAAKAPSDREAWVMKGGDDLGFPAVALSMGGAFLYASAFAQSWAHECGHHRQMEHAAAGPGASLAQHDTEDIPGYDTQARPKVLEETYGKRDLLCIMGYTKSGAGDDRFFCGKCILKNRGWKVESGLQLTNVEDR